MLFVPFFCISTLQSTQFIRLLYSAFSLELINLIDNNLSKIQMKHSLFFCRATEIYAIFKAEMNVPSIKRGAALLSWEAL